jgi:fructokinase
MFDITALGEVLIDFTPTGDSADGKMLYEANPGGAPANVAAAAGKLGAKTAFIGKTGEDGFGKLIAESLEGCGVYTEGMRVAKDQHTTLAFVSLSPSGEREFSFCRNPGADTQLCAEELDNAILEHTSFLHIGSLSLCAEPERGATFKAVGRVKSAGGLVSYDPNWRRPLWRDERTGVAAMKSLIPYADMIKVSDEELYLLAGLPYIPYNAADSLNEYRSLTNEFLDDGVFLILVTLGSDGVYFRTKAFDGIVPCFPVQVVDTTGAGDSFTGALLYRLTRKEKPFSFSKDDLAADLAFANAVASLCVTKRGAIPALPSLEDVERFLLTDISS